MSPEATLDLRQQGAAEESPVHARSVDGEMMARQPIPHLPAADAVVREGDGIDRDNVFRLAPGRGRVLWPAALPERAGSGIEAFGLLLPEVARRRSEARPEHPAEVRGVVEAASECDFGDGEGRMTGACKIGRRALQPPLAHVMTEAVAGALEKLLQISFGDAFGLRHVRRRQLGVVEPPLDRSAEPGDQRLRAGALALAGGRRGRDRGGEKQLCQAQLDGGPVGLRHQVEAFAGAAQRRRQDHGEPVGREDPRRARRGAGRFAGRAEPGRGSTGRRCAGCG